MPKGPQGQRRPADVVSAAVMVGKIATGDIVERLGKAPGQTAGSKAGGKARAKNLAPEKRSAIAKKGATARWKKKTVPVG